ncbi:MAG: DUF2125 domain-containing protein [Alphaproteobacteria bacterium]|nr:DUF2125 domain-containing protein [Alphaproteobacteria bacterium]
MAISHRVNANLGGLALRYRLLLAGVALLVAGYCGYWFLAAAWLRQGIETWCAGERAAGAAVDYQRLQVGGFPFRLIATLEAPRYAEPGTPAGFSWQADRLVGYLQPWNFRHALVALDGNHRLSFNQGGLTRRIEIAVRQGLASYQGTTGGRLERLSIAVDELAMDDRLVSGEWRAQHAEWHLRPSPPGRPAGWDAALTLRNAQAALLAGLPLGPDLSAVELDATLSGDLPRAPFPIAVAAWRDAGGTLELRKLTIAWGDLKVESQGTLALDPETRPIGALTARIHNHERLLELAQGAGQLTPPQASAARLALGLLASANGGVLSVPVRLQDGFVRLGPAALGRLSPLLPDAARNPPPGSPGPRQ